MKKYDILILEEDERVVQVEAKNINDAMDIVERKIESEEIILDPSNYNRTLLNSNSKELTSDLNIYLRFSTEEKKVTFFTDDNQEEYNNCHTVRDLTEVFSRHCSNYLEDYEIESKEDDLEK